MPTRLVHTAVALILCGVAPAASQPCTWKPDLSIESDLRLGDKQATCQFAQLLSGEVLACHWAFAYRSPQAVAAVRELVEALERCFAASAVDASVLPVNHPDTHIVQVYDTGAGRVVVSMKDKAALGQSFVFLQIQEPPQN